MKYITQHGALYINWCLLAGFVAMSFLHPYIHDTDYLGTCNVYFNPMLFMFSFIMALVCSFQLMRTFMHQKKATPFLIHYVVPLFVSLSIGTGVYKHLQNNIETYQSMFCG